MEGSGLGLNEIEHPRLAFEQALHALCLVDRNDPTTEMVAKKIIEIAKAGGEPSEIAQRTIKALGVG